MKRTIAFSALATVLSAGAVAQATTLTPTNDTFIRTDGSTGHGQSQNLVVMDNGGFSTNNRVAIVRFNYGNTQPVSEASLELTFSHFDNVTIAEDVTFAVYGIRDGGCGEGFNEDTVSTSTVPGLFLGDVFNSLSPCLYDGNSTVPGTMALGTFTISTSATGELISFTSDALLDFIEANRNSKLTFVIAESFSMSSPKANFASKESSTYAPPTLNVEHLGSLAYDSVSSDLTSNGDGSYHYEGDLPIPTGGGSVITMPDAMVDMTFDANGNLDTLSGTVGYPELPSTGLFNGLGPMSGASNYLSIGFDYPANFDTVGLPFDPDIRYFYLLEESGASVSWGALSCETPGAGATMFAIEARSPSVFFYSDQLFGDSALESLAVGVSGGNNIGFEPWYTYGVESKMTSFDGDAYLGGSVSISTSIPGVDVNVTGDMTVDVKNASFISGSGVDWMYDLGVNGDVSLSAGLGPFSLSYYLGGGTFRYANRTNDWIAFSGIIEPDDIDGLPFQPKGYALLSGYLNENIDNSYIDLEGEIQFGTSFAKQDIEAAFHLEKDPTSGWLGSLSGSAKFAGTTIGVSGTVTSSYATFSGSITHKFGVSVEGYVGGSVEVDIDASFDSRNAEVDVGGNFKFCWKDPITGKHCDSIGGNVSVNASGNIKVCGNVFGDTKCDTLI